MGERYNAKEEGDLEKLEWKRVTLMMMHQRPNCMKLIYYFNKKFVPERDR